VNEGGAPAPTAEPWWRPARWAGPDWRVPALLGAFVVSRVLYRLAGVAFDTRSTWRTWIFLDRRVLEDDLIGSIGHLHSQPPLLNLFYGLTLRLPESLQKPVYTLTFVALGALLTYSLYALARGLGVPRNLAFVATLLFVVGPTCVLYENWFHYAYPAAVLLVASGLFLMLYLRSGKASWGVAFFVALAVLMLTRSSYHLVFLLAMVVLVAWATPGRARTVIVIAALPVLVVLLWYGKNLVMFDSFSSSSWLGMNLARTVYLTEGPDEIARLRARGEIDPILAVKPFSAPVKYRPRFANPDRTDVQVLDQVTRQANGGVNFNHAVYPEVSDEYLSAVLDYWRAHPDAIARSGRLATRFELLPADQYYWLADGAGKVEGLQRLYDRFVMWQPDFYDADGFLGYRLPGPGRSRAGDVPTPGAANFSYMVLLVYGLGLIGGPIVAWGARGAPDRRAVVVSYLWLVLAYGVIVNTFSDVGENNRFRFETDPVALVLALVTVAGIWRWARARRVGESPVPEVTGGTPG
jgi:hypothetical protein